MALSDWKLGGTLIETSAIDPFLAGAFLDIPGPFVVSTYALSEKACLPPEDFRDRLHGLEGRVEVLVCPHPSLFFKPGAPFFLVPLNATVLLPGQHDAAVAVQAMKATMVQRLDGSLDKVRATGVGRLKPANTPKEVARLVVEVLGARPTDSSDASEHLRWHHEVWVRALAIRRSQAEKNEEKQLRNDPIDALHYILAATFCDRIVTCDRDMRRIHDVLPAPRGELVYFPKAPRS